MCLSPIVDSTREGDKGVLEGVWMNDLQSWRIAIGINNMNKSSRTAPKNKFFALHLAFRIFLVDVFSSLS